MPRLPPDSYYSGNSAEASRIQLWEGARTIDVTPNGTRRYVPQGQKRSVGRAVRQPAPDSGNSERVPPTPDPKAT